MTDTPTTCDPRPFLRHQALAMRWCQVRGQRATAIQVSRVMRQFTAADLERLLTRPLTPEPPRMPPTPTTTTRTDSRSGRFYDITHADGTRSRYPSVTTIISAISKPALVGWAAREERLACLEAAADLHAETAGQQLPRAAYLLTLEQRLGTTKAHVKALAKAGEIGSAAHAKIEWTLKRALGQRVGPEPVLQDAALWAFMAFEDLRQAIALTPRVSEHVVFSRTHAYAGTLDMVATLQTRPLLAILERQGPVDAHLAEWLTTRETATAVADIKTGRSVYPEAFLQVASYQRAYTEMGHGAVDGGLIFRLPKVATDPQFEVVVVPPARELFPTFLAVRQLFDWTFQQEQIYQAKRTRT